MAVRSDGRFYAVGSDADTAFDGSEYGIKGDGNWFLARFLPNGKFDKSFGRLGRVPLKLDPAIDENYDTTSNDNRSIHLASDGKLTLVCWVDSNSDPSDYSNPYYPIYRYDDSGHYDPTFNNGQLLQLQTAVDNIDWPALSVALEQPRAAFSPDGHVFISGANDTSITTANSLSRTISTS